MTPDLVEFRAAQEATRHLEADDPEGALMLLREVRLSRAASPPDEANEHCEIRRLRSYIEQAIDEIEIAYPGHALRTLRIAVGRAPLG